jgi:hypothetical protein
MVHMHFLVDIATLIPQYLGCRRACPLEVGLLKGQGSKSARRTIAHGNQEKGEEKSKEKVVM